MECVLALLIVGMGLLSGFCVNTFMFRSRNENVTERLLCSLAKQPRPSSPSPSPNYRTSIFRPRLFHS
jgi:hypothetical protein